MAAIPRNGCRVRSSLSLCCIAGCNAGSSFLTANVDRNPKAFGAGLFTASRITWSLGLPERKSRMNSLNFEVFLSSLLGAGVELFEILNRLRTCPIRLCTRSIPRYARWCCFGGALRNGSRTTPGPYPHSAAAANRRHRPPLFRLEVGEKISDPQGER